MYKISFRVNLETVDRQRFLQPSRTVLAGNEKVTEADNMKNTRSIFLPNLLRSNIEGIGPSGYLRHNDIITAYGLQAVYLKKTYVTGSQNDVLSIIPEYIDSPMTCSNGEDLEVFHSGQTQVLYAHLKNF
jgi:hypothetical protein